MVAKHTQSSDKPHDPDGLMKAEQLMAEVTEPRLCAEPCADNSSLETTTLASTPMPDDTPQEKQQYTLTARSNIDARECLNLTENMDIHRCAENYR